MNINSMFDTFPGVKAVQQNSKSKSTTAKAVQVTLCSLFFLGVKVAAIDVRGDPENECVREYFITRKMSAG